LTRKNDEYITYFEGGEKREEDKNKGPSKYSSSITVNN
jgi:hypothetical protein